MKRIAVCVPYYRQPKMLEVHLDLWTRYYPQFVRDALQFVIVDDGSAEQALDVCKPYLAELQAMDAHLYRVTPDIPWNRGGARNLASREEQSEWLLHMDTDHILPVESMVRLVEKMNDICLIADKWFRFPRWRYGKADSTRNKDALGRDEEFGRIKPHIDSYLCPRETYWSIGGYDEDYSGCLGGGSPFLKNLEMVAPVKVLPPDINMWVYTKDKCPDSSVFTLDRDTSEYKRRKEDKQRRRSTLGKNPVRFEWMRIL